MLVIRFTNKWWDNKKLRLVSKLGHTYEGAKVIIK